MLRKAVAHCSAGLELAVGDRIPERLLLGRILADREADGAWERRTDAPEFTDDEGSCGAG